MLRPIFDDVVAIKASIEEIKEELKAVMEYVEKILAIVEEKA